MPSDTARSDADDLVLLVSLSRRFGGVENRVLAVARGISRTRPVLVACLDGSPLHRAVVAAGLAAWTTTRGRGDPRTVVALRRLLQERRPAVVDAHNVQSQFWSFLATRLVRHPTLVATVHSQYRQEQQGRRRAGPYELVLKLLARAGTSFIAVSDSVHDYLLGTGVGAERLAVVCNAVEVAGTAALDRGSIRRDLGLDADEFVAVTVARVTPIKGHRVFLEALGQLDDGAARIRWLVVGDGPAQDELTRRAVEIGVSERIRWLGFRGDVPALLHASDACVLPSLSEGLPLALLEAVGQGVPVLATRVGAVPELFEHGTTARLVSPDDPAGLARELRWLLAHPVEREELARAARQALAERLDVTAMVRGTLAAYDRSRRRRHAM